jgi:hypothetical protein
MIGKKFASGLSEHYNEIKFEEISETSEAILSFLSEVNAGEESVNYINNYIFHRTCFAANGNPRKMKSIFSSELDGTKTKEYNFKEALKNFRAATFSIKNEVFEKAPPGWVITDVEDIDWLGELFTKEVNFSDI